MFKKKQGAKTIVRGVAFSLGCLLILTWIAAFLIWNGKLSINTMKICAPLFCLLAGFVALLSNGKGEGSARELLLSGVVSAMLVLLPGTILSAKEGVSYGLFINAGCLLLPCLIPVLKFNKRSYHRYSAMKHHRSGPKHR